MQITILAYLKCFIFDLVDFILYLDEDISMFFLNFDEYIIHIIFSKEI